MPLSRRFFSYLLYGLFFLTLAGCASNFQSATDSIKALSELKNANLTPEYIAAVPYANSLVTINDGKPLLMVLGFADKTASDSAHRLSWLADDYGAIVTQHGRIVQTLGFPYGNLESLTHPNARLEAQGHHAVWSARYDWSPGYRYGFEADIRYDLVGWETLSTEMWREEVEHITETVTFKELNTEFTNHYWRVPATDKTPAYVIKSVQYLGPKMDKIEILMMRPFIEPFEPLELKNTDIKNTSNKEAGV